jgi:hypothetical protein
MFRFPSGSTRRSALLAVICVVGSGLGGGSRAGADPHLAHYGFVVVDSGWHDPLDAAHPLRTDYTDELTGFTDTNHLVIFDYQDDVVARLQNMARRQMKALLAVEGVLFDNDPPNPASSDRRGVRPFPDYRERWARFVEINRVALNEAHVQTFYVVDEPYARGLTFDEVRAATDLVAATFPDIPVSVVEAWFALDDLVVPTSVDWIGFDDFVGDPYHDPIFRRELATVHTKLSRSDQQIILVMWANWTPLECCVRGAEPYLPSGMGRVAESYYLLAREDPSVVALVGYLWAGGIDGVQLGARDLPQTVRETYVRIGNEILGR